MAFAQGTSVTFTTETGKPNVGTVEGFENGKYRIKVSGDDGKIVEIEEAKVTEFKIEMQERSLFGRIGR